MQSGARAIAIVVLQSMLAAYAFAGDANKSANDPLENRSSDAIASVATAPESDTQQTAKPAPTPRSNSSSTSSSSMRGENTPAVELFLGYSYVRFNTTTGVITEHFDMMPGGTGQLSFNVNNWLGLAADFSGYGLHDVGGVDGKLYTYLFGPRFVFSRGKRWSPFVNVFAGGARVTSNLHTGVVPDTLFFNSSFHQNSFAAVGGVGLDLNLNKRLALRVGQFDGLLTKFHDNKNRQVNVRASGGLVFRFGYGEAAPSPVHHNPTATCSADPGTVHLETTEVATIRADANSADGLPLNITWSATGGSVDGTGPSVRWTPGNAAAGNYTVTAHVDDGQGGTASCSTDVHVEPRPNRPPTMTCSASPTSIPAGDKATITANASDPDNDPLNFTWTTSGGRITGSGASVQFDSTGVQPGTYTVTGNVSDGRGGSANCTVTITATKPAEQIRLEQTLSLHSIFFPTAQPTVKNPNGGLLASQQRVLTDEASNFKKYLTYKPDATLTLAGHADPRGSAVYNKALSERRVARVKSFLVEQGVPADHIQTEGLGAEQSLSAPEIKKLADEDTSLTPEQRARIVKNARVIALAQNRRVDSQLTGTGQTSERKFPFNAEDVLNLINPRGATTPAKKGPAPTRRPRARRPAGAAKK